MVVTLQSGTVVRRSCRYPWASRPTISYISYIYILTELSINTQFREPRGASLPDHPRKYNEHYRPPHRQTEEHLSERQCRVPCQGIPSVFRQEFANREFPEKNRGNTKSLFVEIGICSEIRLFAGNAGSRYHGYHH